MFLSGQKYVVSYHDSHRENNRRHYNVHGRDRNRHNRRKQIREPNSTDRHNTYSNLYTDPSGICYATMVVQNSTNRAHTTKCLQNRGLNCMSCLEHKYYGHIAHSLPHHHNTLRQHIHLRHIHRRLHFRYNTHRRYKHEHRQVCQPACNTLSAQP
jgi:hypothetical protein